MKILPNGIAVLDHDTHISRWVQQSGHLDHDQNMLPLLVPYLSGTVVDVGAFIGDHTVFYARHAQHVYAIEPNPAAFECLAHNTQGMAVTALNVGLSDRFTTMGMAHDPNAGASHAVPEGNIPVITLDSLNLPACDFIKLDCEGMEPLALMGGEATIAKHHPVMLIEINQGALARQGHHPQQIYDFLHRHGYRSMNVYAGQPIAGDQFDLLCIPG